MVAKTILPKLKKRKKGLKPMTSNTIKIEVLMENMIGDKILQNLNDASPCKDKVSYVQHLLNRNAVLIEGI